jgi:hypothetical protein
MKRIDSLQTLLTIACILSGFLAGENIYRYLVEVPAWRHINIIYWGEYSRHADLSYRGIFLFPTEAIISALLLLIASIIILSQKGTFKSATWPVHAATIFALIGLGLTFFAAPYMLSVRTMPNDPALLQCTFNRFHFWGLWRALAQILSFCATAWAMTKVFKSEK